MKRTALRRVGLAKEAEAKLAGRMVRSTIARRTPLAKANAAKKSWTKVLDKLCCDVVFARDKVCQRTGSRDNLQWAHVRSRRYWSSRWDPDNSLVLSAKSHLWAHHEPLEFAEWFTLRWPDRAARLKLAAMRKPNLAATELFLKAELQRLTK